MMGAPAAAPAAPENWFGASGTLGATYGKLKTAASGGTVAMASRCGAQDAPASSARLTDATAAASARSLGYRIVRLQQSGGPGGVPARREARRQRGRASPRLGGAAELLQALHGQELA